MLPFRTVYGSKYPKGMDLVTVRGEGEGHFYRASGTETAQRAPNSTLTCINKVKEEML